MPTLVEKRGGGIVYGLKPDDFVLEDNGVPQKIRVQEEMDTAPVALVVAVEEGGVSALEFDKLAKLGPLLDMFLSDSRSQAALVGFDSKPHLLQDYTHSGEDEMDDALTHLQQGNGGDAILDTVSYAVDLLETQPKEYRRVLLLISEERDHGSKHTKPEQLIEKIGRSDVLVLSVSFSPSRAELLHDMKDSGDNRTMNMISPFVMMVQAFKKNAAEEVARMSGGEYTTFTGDKRVRAASFGGGQARAQSLSDYVQSLRSDARPAYDPGENCAGLWRRGLWRGPIIGWRGSSKRPLFGYPAFPFLTDAAEELLREFRL